MIVNPEVLRSFGRFFTPLVSDVMDRLGIPSHVLAHEIQSIPFDPTLKVAGVAYPCRVVPTKEYVEIDKLLAMVDSIPEHAFVIVASDADIDAALWGGLMSTRAKARGAVAAAVNGGIRDFEQIAKLDFPVFGSYRCIKDIRRRGYMAEYNVTVTIGDVRIEPCDVVFGDANGVVVIPQAHFERVYVELMKSIEGEHKTAQGLTEGRAARELFSEFETF
ncbi:MAG: RraA family protein [Bacteroidota bacterium]|nr:RraA family protein [Bacteroidota bacterium]MDP4232119.1 RraA family protein [Bacteroidota bacterium]MDP4241173.1 RraA family protein [Bacteroidota bacterium]MDP4286565.1 RraA family protein [Bacteroidota bacterium]